MLSGKICEFDTQPRKSIYHLIFTVSRILAQNNHLAQNERKKIENRILPEKKSENAKLKKKNRKKSERNPKNP